MEYGILGPLEVRNDGEAPLPLGGSKQRALLALLLLNANQVVARERLIDELWGDDPPETAVATVQVYVSRLRKLLTPAVLRTSPPGYVLDVDADDVDLLRFEDLFSKARESSPRDASRLLREALELWRGPALAEFEEPFGRIEGGRLEDLRLAALEDRVDADLALGGQAELVGELETLVAKHPHRERLRGQLMLALYRSGRQAEALEAYRDARTALDELGLEPGEQLRELERAILTHDAKLKEPSALPRLPTGTVTFLFSDVEGSTRLLKQLRDRYGAVLSEHQRVLRETFAAHGGQEVDSEGDACFFVFARARDAAIAAAAAQRSLAEQAWPEGVELRVRMGLHTGEPQLSDDGRYFGIGVHRTARIMAVGHGGQILLSRATASVLLDEEVDGIVLRDLGDHELKDFDRPERIYQLEVAGLSADFPPLTTRASRENFELIAASLRANARDLDVFVEVLAEKFEASVPDATHVERGGLRGGGRVKTIAVELRDHSYRLDAGGRHPSRSHIVRGITLKSDDLGLDEWIDSLAHDLAQEAERTERGRLALAEFLDE